MGLWVPKQNLIKGERRVGREDWVLRYVVRYVPIQLGGDE